MKMPEILEAQRVSIFREEYASQSQLRLCILSKGWSRYVVLHIVLLDQRACSEQSMAEVQCSQQSKP